MMTFSAGACRVLLSIAIAHSGSVKILFKGYAPVLSKELKEIAIYGGARAVQCYVPRTRNDGYASIVVS